MPQNILLVEDDDNIVELLKFNLEKEGYEVLTASDGQTGLELGLSESVDLILLDVMLPGLDGFEVCRRVREAKSTPIVMITARVEEEDKVLGLDLGADDYITKPFSSIKELMARVKANVRRSAVSDAAPSQPGRDVIRRRDMELDLNRMEVRVAGKAVDLSAREYELVKFLAAQPGKVFTREELMEQVWGYDVFAGGVRMVDVTVRRLREKIEKDPADPAFVMTRRGAGYYFEG